MQVGYLACKAAKSFIIEWDSGYCMQCVTLHKKQLGSETVAFTFKSEIKLIITDFGDLLICFDFYIWFFESQNLLYQYFD